VLLKEPRQSLPDPDIPEGKNTVVGLVGGRIPGQERPPLELPVNVSGLGPGLLPNPGTFDLSGL